MLDGSEDAPYHRDHHDVGEQNRHSTICTIVMRQWPDDNLTNISPVHIQNIHAPFHPNMFDPEQYKGPSRDPTTEEMVTAIASQP
jgi:hypothetical protein